MDDDELTLTFANIEGILDSQWKLHLHNIGFEPNLGSEFSLN